METKYKNTFAENLKKGEAGERWFSNILNKKGYKVYSDLRFERETADLITIKNGEIFIFHVKRKNRRVYYPDTGIDKRHLKNYMDIHLKNNITSFIVFIDEHPEVNSVLIIELTKFNDICEERTINIVYVDLNQLDFYCKIDNNLDKR